MTTFEAGPPELTEAGPGGRDRRPSQPWSRLVLAVTVVTAAADLTAMLLQRSIIPPVLVGAVLSLGALPILSWRPKVGVGTIGVITLFLLLTGGAFAVPPLSHPNSPIGFIHAAAYVLGRGILLVAVVGALLSRSARAARFGTAAATVTGIAILLTTTVATATRPNPQPVAGDVPVVMKGFEFPRETVVPAGATLFVRNDDTVWHRVEITRTDIRIDVAAGGGARVPVDLVPGRYAMFCDITGHKAMAGQLTVTER